MDYGLLGLCILSQKADHLPRELMAGVHPRHDSMKVLTRNEVANILKKQPDCVTDRQKARRLSLIRLG